MHYVLKNTLDTEVSQVGGIQQNVDYNIFCNEHNCAYFKSRYILKDLYIMRLCCIGFVEFSNSSTTTHRCISLCVNL
jgi:hypothetical protein